MQKAIGLWENLTETEKQPFIDMATNEVIDKTRHKKKRGRPSREETILNKRGTVNGIKEQVAIQMFSNTIALNILKANPTLKPDQLQEIVIAEWKKN